jgi:hypothetical protein
LPSTKLEIRNFLRQKTRCAIRHKTAALKDLISLRLGIVNHKLGIRNFQNKRPAALIENGFRACKSIKIHAVCSMLPERPLVRESLSFNDFFQNEKKPQE